MPEMINHEEIDADRILDANKNMLDLHKVESVEVLRLSDGRLWVNLNGICVLRIKNAERLDVTDEYLP